MSKTKITAPVKFSGPGVGGLDFTEGVAHTDDDGIIEYCRRAGYTIGGEEPDNRPLDASELAELRRQMTILAPDAPPDLDDEQLLEMLTNEGVTPADVRKAIAEPIDPRKLDNGGSTTVGTALRDAAVDPQDVDFLPPTNAGQANPHGPLVVAPGIHNLETKVVIPGPVPDDLDEQQAKLTEHAEKTLVKNMDLRLAVPGFTRSQDPEAQTHPDDGTGPLGLSDPGSTAQRGDAADPERSDNEEGTDDSGTDGTGPAYDPATGTVDQVNAYLDEHPDEAVAVLAAEAAGKNRAGIVTGPHAAQD